MSCVSRVACCILIFVIDLTDENFKEEVLEAELPVLVDFYADWCGPCKMAAPILEKLSLEYEGKVKFCKMNVEEGPKAAEENAITSIPAAVIFKEGKEEDRMVGLMDEVRYRQTIEKHTVSKQ